MTCRTGTAGTRFSRQFCVRSANLVACLYALFRNVPAPRGVQPVQPREARQVRNDPCASRLALRRTCNVRGVCTLCAEDCSQNGNVSSNFGYRFAFEAAASQPRDRCRVSSSQFPLRIPRLCFLRNLDAGGRRRFLGSLKIELPSRPRDSAATSLLGNKAPRSAAGEGTGLWRTPARAAAKSRTVRILPPGRKAAAGGALTKSLRSSKRSFSYPSGSYVFSA